MTLSNAQPGDAYAHHLSQVNQKNQVLATEDIRNEKGVLLVKKGTPISEKMADQVVKHKLTRPLEHSVNLENVIDAGRLFKAFSSLFKRYPDCETVHHAQTLQLLLRELCSVYDGYSLLKQKLTVLSMQRPHDFEKGLFCAWFSMALAHKMDLPQQQISDAFLAGLMHDTGMLHISRDILDKKGQLTPDDWRTIQSHPLIGELFLKQIPGLSPMVARATLEHHERRDGTGYPVGKFEEKLSTVGQIVAIADSICAIRMLRLSSSGGNLANLLPIIQFNGRSYDPECYRALFSMIRSAGLQPGRMLSDKEVAAEIDSLISAHQQLNSCFEPLAEVLEFLPEDSDQRRIRSAVLLVQGCWFAVASSGLLAASLSQWLGQIKSSSDQTSYAAVEEIKVMLKELHWQLVQVRKSLAMLKGAECFQVPQTQQALNQALQVQQGLDQVFKR
ncbi:MAG: HD domain-containing phosphohydrolase [Halopseudomonas sp.]